MISISDNSIEYKGTDKILGFEAVAVFMSIYELAGAQERYAMIKTLLDLLKEQT